VGVHCGDPGVLDLGSDPGVFDICGLPQSQLSFQLRGMNVYQAAYLDGE